MSLAYRLAGRLLAPGLRVMLNRRAKRGKEVPGRLGERFGLASLPRPAGRLVWIHAASVGETMSVLPLVEAMAGVEVLLTTGTVTSAALAAARLPAFARHQFVPLDVPGWVAAFYDHWRPDCAVFVESELWPGLLSAADARGIPRLLVNARMSARSAARWRRLPGPARAVLAPFRYVHVQSASDAANLRLLGAHDVLEWGNLKYAAPLLPVDGSALAALRVAVRGPAWLAASTHAGEEAMVITAHRALAAAHPGLLTIIVPRHPARGAEVAALADGLKVARRSLGAPPPAGGVYVADTLNELGLFYRLAPFAFIGNSLVAGGGHNVIEPAVLGVPVITGPYTENFSEPVARLERAGGLVRVADAAGLAESAGRWLADAAACRRAGEAARLEFAGANDLPARLAALILSAAL